MSQTAKSSLDGHSGGDEPSSALKAAALDPGWGCPAVFIVLPKNRSNALVSSQDVFKRYAEAPTMDDSRLTLRAALAADLLEDFVRQARNGNMGRDPAILECNQTKALRGPVLLR